MKNGKSDKREVGVLVGEWVTGHPWWIIVLSIVFVVVAGSGVRFLTFDTDYRAFFSKVNPQLMAFEELQDTYTKNDNVMFVLAPNDENVFKPETLEAVIWLTEQGWQIPYSIRVDSISNFQHTRGEGDDLIVEDLIVDPVSLTTEELDRIKRIALNEPRLLNRLISKHSHVTGVNVTVHYPGVNQSAEVPEVVAFARDIANQLRERYPHLDVNLSGAVMMGISFPEASQKDIKTLNPVMLLIILVLIGFLLRGFTPVFSTLLLLILSIIAAMGLAGWARIGITGPSATAPVIILTLAVADSIHFLSTMLHEMRINGREKLDAIIESLRVNFQPIFLTSLTTAIGFLTMNFGEVPPFAHMGNIVASGVMIAFVFSVTLLPALMFLLPVRVKQRQNGKLLIADQIAEFVVNKRRPLLWGMGAIIVFLVVFIPRNELNDVFVKYFDESFEFRRATDFMNENLTGIYDLHYSLGAGEDEGISDPEFLDNVEDFANWYRQQPGVVHVGVITDTFKRLNKNLHGDDDAFYRLPDDRQLAAQYLLLYEMSLPYGLDLNNEINVGRSAIKMSVTMETMSTNEILQLTSDAREWLKENGLPSMQVEGSSSTVMFAHIGARNIRAMLTAATGALILISLILLVALRSIKYGLVSLIPNLVPAAMGFGLWGLLYGQVGLALSVVASITLGVIVDDTIHFMSKYLRARREKALTGPDAVRYAFHTVGTALMVTTVVLTAGFLVLAQSHFKINEDMGLLTAITIVIALIVDFLFLPPLLMKLEEKKDESIDTAGARDLASA